MYQVQNAVKEIVPTTLNLNSAKPQLVIRCNNANYMHVYFKFSQYYSSSRLTNN